MRRLLALFLAVVVVCGCTPPRQPTTRTVRVGNVPSLLFGPLYVAIEQGHMKAQGIEVQLETIKAGQDAVAFLANGQLDFIAAGYSAALINAVERGMDVKVIAPMGIQPKEGDASPLVARKDIPDVAHLKGKRIAVPGGAGSAGSFLVALRLKAAGLTLKDVELVNLALPDHPAALASGAVDAAQMAEPYASQALARGDGVALAPGALAGVNASGILTSGKLIGADRALVVAFTRALLQATRDIETESLRGDRLAAIYARYTGLPEAMVLSAVPYHFDPTFDLNVTRRDLEQMETIMQQAGIVQKVVSVDRLVDPGPAAAANR